MKKQFIGDVSTHEQCKTYAMYMYEKNDAMLPKGTKILNVDFYPQTAGFDAMAFQKGDNIMISFKGSFNSSIVNNKDDLGNDYDIFGRGKQPNQMIDAEGYLKRVQSQYPDKKIILVGYSLGGTEAAILGSKYGIDTVTFNPLGIKNLDGVEINHPGCVVNYCNRGDKMITMANARNHVGTCYYVSKKKGYFGLSHDLEAFQPLNTRQQFDQSEIHTGYNTAAENVHNLKVEYNRKISRIREFMENKKQKIREQIIRKRGLSAGMAADMSTEELIKLDRNMTEREIFTPENRVFYSGEINPAKVGKNDDLYEYVPKYLEQYWKKDFKLPREEELKQKVKTGELIYVHDYVRSDGTKVSGYYRHQG